MSELDKKEETIERVLFNPRNGKLAVGVRLRFMDKYHTEALGNLGEYVLKMEPNDCDAWAIDDENGIWVVVPVSEYTKHIEDLGPL